MDSGSLKKIDEEHVADHIGLTKIRTTEPTVESKEGPPREDGQQRGLSECASIEAINPVDIQKQVREAACDPIEFSKELLTKGIEMAVQTLDDQETGQLTRREVVAGIDQDWAHSVLFRIVVDTSRLPLKKRNEEQRILEEKRLNPDDEDIFTETEAGYNASLLMN
jgi:hypothetical protein